MHESTDKAFVLGPGEGRSIDLGGFRMVVKASPEQTSGAFSLLEADEPAGFGPPLHIHDRAAEAFYVIEGEYIIYLDTRELTCPAGSFIFIPAGAPHGFRVGRVASRKLNLYAPAAMVGYFDELSDATSKGAVSPELPISHRAQVFDAGDRTSARGLCLGARFWGRPFRASPLINGHA